MNIDPKTFNLTNLYQELNRNLFHGELEDHPIQWNKIISKQYVGITNAKIKVPPGTPKWMHPYRAKLVPGSIKITICPYHFPLDMLKGIVAHEMIHALTFQLQQFDSDAHGEWYTNHWHIAKQQAVFDIPFKHTDVSDVRLLGNRTPQPVSFVLYFGKSYNLSFYPKNFFTTVNLTSTSSRLRIALERKQIEWYVIGTAVSMSAISKTILRKFDGRGFTYKSITPQDLDRITVLAQEGPVPDPLITQTPQTP